MPQPELAIVTGEAQTAELHRMQAEPGSADQA